MRRFTVLVAFVALATVSHAVAQTSETVVVPTRPRVTQRMLVLTPAEPRASAIGFAGCLQIQPHGSMAWGAGNFLIRTRTLWADHGLRVVVVDSPSDRSSPPLSFSQDPRQDHALTHPGAAGFA